MKSLSASMIIIISISAAGAFISSLVPAKYEKYLKNIISMILLSTLISPITSFFGILNESIDFIVSPPQTDVITDNSNISGLITEFRKTAENNISNDISEKYDIEPPLIDVSVNMDSEKSSSIKIKSIKIIVKCEINCDNCSEYISSKYGCPDVETEYKEGWKNERFSQEDPANKRDFLHNACSYRRNNSDSNFRKAIG